MAEAFPNRGEEGLWYVFASGALNIAAAVSPAMPGTPGDGERRSDRVLYGVVLVMVLVLRV
jgi:hypothetical protein